MNYLSHLWLNAKTAFIALLGLLQSPEVRSFELSKLHLPDNFSISVFARIPAARSLSLSPSGTLFVGTRGAGKVYAVLDTDKNFVADKIYTLAQDLGMPNGIAFHKGDLYVADIHQVLRFKDVENNLAKTTNFEVIYKKLPRKFHHGWRYIAFGKDGLLYMAVGAPCNVCLEKDPIFATIIRINLETKTHEIIAQGVRNSVGFDWHPLTSELWFTDNGRDFLGDNLPPCELNSLSQKNQHFGFPYCHGKNIADRDFNQKTCDSFVPPRYEFPAHVSPLGMRFYTGKMFPKKYRNQIFVAEHGSWNRTKKVGYKVSLIELENNRVISYTDFIKGFLQPGEEVLGRPVDIIVDHTGALLISDDRAGLIYRVTYKE